MSASGSSRYVSRGGEKLAAALDHFTIDVAGLACADLGSHVGGFADCLLRRGAGKVYCVDTGYGTLAWKLRKDPRIVVLERTNAMHVELPEPVGLVVIDVGWTPQSRILPAARRLLAARGLVLTLIKPQYEAAKRRSDEATKAGADEDKEDGVGPPIVSRGVVPDDEVEGVVTAVVADMTAAGWDVAGRVESVIRGHGGNREFFVLLSARP